LALLPPPVKDPSSGASQAPGPRGRPRGMCHSPSGAGCLVLDLSGHRLEVTRNETACRRYTHRRREIPAALLSGGTVECDNADITQR
jgi:hypothetical protein